MVWQLEWYLTHECLCILMPIWRFVILDYLQYHYLMCIKSHCLALVCVRAQPSHPTHTHSRGCSLAHGNCQPRITIFTSLPCISPLKGGLTVNLIINNVYVADNNVRHIPTATCRAKVVDRSIRICWWPPYKNVDINKAGLGGSFSRHCIF